MKLSTDGSALTFLCLNNLLCEALLVAALHKAQVPGTSLQLLKLTLTLCISHPDKKCEQQQHGAYGAGWGRGLVGAGAVSFRLTAFGLAECAEYAENTSMMT